MRLLFIGPYRQIDNWGLSSYHYLKALSTHEDIELVSRPVTYNKLIRQDLEQEILELEDKCFPHYDRILQMVPPFEFCYTPESIGLSIIEPTCLYDQNWKRRLELIQRLIVGSYSEQQTLNDVNLFTNVVLPPVDVEANLTTYPRPDIPDRGQYTFYWIGEYGDFNNWREIYQAYHLSFERADNVHLVMYFIAEQNPQFLNQIQQELLQIKGQLNKYPRLNYYKEDTVLVGHSNLRDLRSLHEFGNCLIHCPSGGNVNPILNEAALFGNNIVTTNLIETPLDNNILFSCGTDRPIINSEHYSSKSMWQKPDLEDLSFMIERAHEKTSLSVKFTNPLSYKEVGQQLYEVLVQ